MNDASWVMRAACRDEDVEIFYSREAADMRRAIKICAACPVRRECLADSVERGEWFGVWGGVNERRRRRIVRELGAA